MKKKNVKMNNGDYLSLGNVIKVIKKISSNSNAMQPEIFCSIFGMNNINSTTINNYCIGIRAIALDYKKAFEELYLNNNLLTNFLSIISILDNKIYLQNENALELINKNEKLNKVIKELLKIAQIDKSINDINIFIKENNYETFKELLHYAILENKQPIYKQDINIINKEELEDYLRLKLYWGQNYISELKNLSLKNNIYACADLGSMAYEGTLDGKIDYDKSYEYYLKAANKNHPKACWMIAHMILNNYVKFDFETMWKYLNKSIELGSSAGYNTLGLCYLKGINPENKINKEKAKEYFILASEEGYAYAYNNLGKLSEEENDIDSAIKYYKLSADLNNSWALNKVGEYYRKEGKYKEAFAYYNEAIKCPQNEIYKYAFYNLAKYYYENGNKELGIHKNEKLANEYYNNFKIVK